MSDIEDGPEELDARGHLAVELDRYLTADQLKILIDEVLAIDKKAVETITCKHCQRQQRVTVSVKDARAVTASIGDLLTQAKGRPGEERVDSSVTVNRRLILIREDEDYETEGIAPLAS